MNKFFKSNFFYMLISVVLYLMFAGYLPLIARQFIYTISVLAKEILMLFLPIIAFIFITCAIIPFQKKAPLFIAILLVFVFFMSLFGTWYALLFAKFISSSVIFAKVHDKIVYAMQPLFSLPFTRPSWWAVDNACFVGLAVAIVTVFSNNKTIIGFLDKAKDILQHFLVNFFTKIIPVFVFGFVVQMHESKLIVPILSKYIEFIGWLLVALGTYCIIISLISTKGNVLRAIQDLKRLISPAIIATTSGSSLVAMPWTIAAASKNLSDPKIASLVIPITTNIMMVGDCILNAFLCFLIYSSFYGMDPSFSALWYFSIMFVVMRFAGAAIVGGVIFLMLPIYETYLHFTPDMLFLILALNILLDPIDSFFNVLTKGVLCKTFELIWQKMQINKALLKKILFLCIFIIVLTVLGVVMKFGSLNSVQPPIAQRIKHKTTVHGEELVDHYHWLRDANWPRVSDDKILAYIDAENQYTNSVLSQYKEIQKKIYSELLGRITQEDATVPVRRGEYFYYKKIGKGQQYWTSVRKKIKESDVIGLPSDILMRNDILEQILLDENEIAKNLEKNAYLNIGGQAISPKQNMFAYSIDTKGDERYTIKIKNLEKNSTLQEEVVNAMPSIVWHENNEGFFYIPAGENWRSKKVYYHKIGTLQNEDILIYHKKNDEYTVQISKSESCRYLFVNTISKEDNEILYIDLHQSGFSLQPIIPKQNHVLYGVTHNNDSFYALINDVGENFRLIVASVSETDSIAKWDEVIAHSDDEYLSDMYMYQNNLVLLTKREGLKRIKIFSVTGQNILFEKEILFQDPTYDAGLIFTTFDAPSVRYYYSSLRAPYSIRESIFASLLERQLKVQVIPSGFDPNEYTVERMWAKNPNDSALIPMSVVYKKTLFKADGSNPLLLYGYGSYGFGIPPAFNQNIVSLLDRGFVYVIAHVRGGDDLGLKWYKDAKFLHKKRTFEDFIASADYLIERHYSSAGNIAIEGGSAGGMLVTAVANMRPDLFKAVIALVPFVDVLNTMLDEKLPLTPIEYQEWGNPQIKEFFDYIKSYSPYDNIKAQNYPNMFLKAGLTDPRVAYWEPVKFIAKLRHFKTDNNLVVLRTNMGAGHGGVSGRFNYLNEIAEEYVFMLKTFDMLD